LGKSQARHAVGVKINKKSLGVRVFIFLGVRGVRTKFILFILSGVYRTSIKIFQIFVILNGSRKNPWDPELRRFHESRNVDVVL